MKEVLQALQRNRSLFEDKQASVLLPDAEIPISPPTHTQTLCPPPAAPITETNKLPILPPPAPDRPAAAFSLSYPSIHTATPPAVFDLTAGHAVDFPDVQDTFATHSTDPVENLMRHLETASRLQPQLPEEEEDAW